MFAWHANWLYRSAFMTYNEITEFKQVKFLGKSNYQYYIIMSCRLLLQTYHKQTQYKMHPVKCFDSTQSYYTGQSQRETDNSAMALQVSVEDQQTGKLV